jgi:hypothetical protein
MPRIIDIVRARRDVIKTDDGEAKKTGDLGVAAILSGIGTPEWEAYMRHFPGLTDVQINRLLAEDNTAGDPEMDKKRAYMPANGMCGMNSPNTGNLDFKVNTIDAGLPGAECDPEP